MNKKQRQRIASKKYYATHKSNKQKYNKKYYQKNKKRLKLYLKNYNLTHKEELRLKRHIYYQKNKNRFKNKRRVYSKKRYRNNKIKILKQHKQYRLKNKQKILYYNKKYRLKNKNKIAKKAKKYRKEHKKETNLYMRNKRKKDIYFKIKSNLRLRVWRALTNKKCKVGSAVKDLGCTVYFLKKYLEKQFKSGMTWKNYGRKWHIDHIEPLCSFDLTIRREFLKACHYTNLRPLWKEENLSKISQDKKKSIRGKKQYEDSKWIYIK